MAEYQDLKDAGRLFKNDKKTKPAHPDYRGQLTVDGKKFWISGWLRVPQSGGAKYMSLTLTPAEAQPDVASERKQPADDEIAF